MESINEVVINFNLSQNIFIFCMQGLWLHRSKSSDNIIKSFKIKI
jgi:hypothetical protein